MYYIYTYIIHINIYTPLSLISVYLINTTYSIHILDTILRGFTHVYTCIHTYMYSYTCIHIYTQKSCVYLATKPRSIQYESPLITINHR